MILARVLEVNTLNIPGRWADMARALEDVTRIADSADVVGWQTDARKAIAACLRWGTTPATEAVAAIEGIATTIRLPAKADWLWGPRRSGPSPWYANVTLDAV